ncbi:hypothetical protein EPT53_07550 [Fusobacterium necrophorum]|uniref:Uncharacterized protein n=1 Tax=Fusobacterium necrophorum TaxID=859 RepID=A0A4Q2KYS3_9FUSO|nr:hypothetical protein [Fusobacterium necrophorum]RXZ69143.1 hypothetical protein EPT53_07550 [Fusobacterium necrophorum]
MKIRKLFFVLLPLITGIGIYLLYRSRNLYYYQLLQDTHLHPYISQIRENAKIYRKILSTWSVYSLPDGLWLFSFGSALLLDRVYYWMHLFIFSMIYAIMIGIEYLQKFYGGHGHWLGTFDLHDIEAYTIAYVSILLLSLLFYFFQSKQKIRSRMRELAVDCIYIGIFGILGTLPSLL